MGVRQAVAEALKDLPTGIHHAVPAGVRRNLRHYLGHYYAWEAGFNHHAAPILEAGEVNGPPDFVGVGVQKAGTSWWYHLVMSHPQASARPSIHKERHFFARFGAQVFGPSDVDDYRKWFPRVAGTVTGEWTPDYFYYAWVPPLLAEAAPEAKLLLILRDPIERFRSGLAHQVRSGQDHVGSALAEVVGRSLYSEGVRRFLDHFPTERLLVLQYEQCATEPADQLARTYKFLGLQADYRPGILGRSVNKTAEAKIDLGPDVTRRLEDIFRPDVAELAKLVPELDVSLWPGLAAP